MAKKDKKSKTAEQKARVVAKQNKKAVQKERKGKGKTGDDSDGDNIDLDSQLEEYAKQQARLLEVTETICDPPSARSSATILGSPSNYKELIVFGGEAFDGALARFFNDLFIYNIDRDQWKCVTSPNSPLPRSGHAWCRGGNAGGIYLFGGEFSSPKQGMFYHYNDFWRLDTISREWTRLETKGKGPPARSGHRLTYFKNYIILFGGFQDTSQQTKYLQDLWIYDCQNFIWYNPVLSQATQKPDARSSFSFLPHDLGAVLYGGYSRVKANTAPGKTGKGGQQLAKTMIKPMVHQDTWFLRILPSNSETAFTAPQVRWERRKKPGNAPNPVRAGVTQVFHKGRGLMFGGVHDVEESEEGIESEFFSQLFAWNIERNRFFPLILRRSRPQGRKNVEERTKKGRGKADEVELLRNLAALEQKGSIADADTMDIDDPEAMAGDGFVKPVEKVILNTMPHERYNAQLAIQGDVLYIFGGTFERGDREYNFDEMHAIDLGKLDGVMEIYRRELDNWGDDASSSDSDDEEHDDGSEDDAMEDENGAGVPLPSVQHEAVTKEEKPASRDTSLNTNDLDEEEPPSSNTDDQRPHPRPFESLREFFGRTSAAWQEIVIERLQQDGQSLEQSVKELRKVAFAVAETKWWDSREEIIAEEDRQEEAGIGEVISLADRTKEGPASKRR